MPRNCECQPSDEQEACSREEGCINCGLLGKKVKVRAGDGFEKTALGQRRVRFTKDKTIWMFKDGRLWQVR